ncbi:MAG: ATP-binding cassette domain-containing protein [Ignavibacteriales bacterium]|nr:ATP-binding cassette domain-containing protein [Ignavibacteriales bacterium]
MPEGEFLALMGPSGSGKTTLLNLIGGIDKPSEGSVVIDGKEISGFGESALAKWRSRQCWISFFNFII